MDLRGRPCSKTTTLPCVPEGGSFFAAAVTAGERSPSETIGRYAFLRVRRACALVVGSRKSLFFDSFSYALVSMVENEAFWGLRALVPVSHAGETYFSLLEIIDSATSAGDPLVSQLLRGRRQLPQAGEVRRPPGPACVRWLVDTW